MKKAVFVFSFLVLLMSQQCFAEEQWVQFTASDKSYSILFPGQPQEQVSKEPGMKLVLERYVTQNVGYVSEYTESDAPFDGRQEMIAARDSFLKSIKETLVTSKEIQFERGINDRLPALVFTGAGSGASFKGFLIADNKRLYMFVAGGRENMPVYADKFFDSIKIYRLSK